MLTHPSNQRPAHTVLAMVALSLGAVCWAGDAAVAGASQGPITPGRLPYYARELLTWQGDRLTHSGKERLTVLASVTDAKGSRGARLVWEAPGRFRYDDDNGHSVSYDKSASKAAALTAADSALLETLYYDSTDGFFGALDGGAAYRLLGRGYRIGSAKDNSGKAQLRDSYAVMMPVITSDGESLRSKMYVFDFETHTLLRAVYRAGATKVVTSFSKWTSVDGQLIPGRIERTEDGRITLSIETKSAGLSAKANDGLFSKP